MDDIKLPPLPHGPFWDYSADDVQAYARQAVLDERERIAVRADGLVEWEPCDCGCPNGRAPKDRAAVALIRFAAAIRAPVVDKTAAIRATNDALVAKIREKPDAALRDLDRLSGEMGEVK